MNIKLILFTFLTPLLLRGQKNNPNEIFPLDSESHLIKIEEVVQVDSVAAKELFSRAQLAVARIYNNANHVTQLKDNESFQILAKGGTEQTLKGAFVWYKGMVKFDFIVQVKDGRYKYTIENMSFNGSGDGLHYFEFGDLSGERPGSDKNMCSKKVWLKLKEDTRHAINKMISDFKSFMSSNKYSNKEAW